MKTINISITYEANDELPYLEQIKHMQAKYITDHMEVRDVSYEKEWISGKTRIEFKGVEK